MYILFIFAVMSRQFAAISFLFILLIYLGGVYPVFKIGQWQARSEIKHKIKEAIPERELHLISVSTSANKAIDWVQEGKEFRLNGRMYDVVRQQNEPHHTLLLHRR